MSLGRIYQNYLDRPGRFKYDLIYTVMLTVFTREQYYYKNIQLFRDRGVEGNLDAFHDVYFRYNRIEYIRSLFSIQIVSLAQLILFFRENCKFMMLKYLGKDSGEFSIGGFSNYFEDYLDGLRSSGGHFNKRDLSGFLDHREGLMLCEIDKFDVSSSIGKIKKHNRGLIRERIKIVKLIEKYISLYGVGAVVQKLRSHRGFNKKFKLIKIDGCQYLYV